MLQRGPLPTSGIDSSVLVALWHSVSYSFFPREGADDAVSVWHYWRPCLLLPDFREWAGSRAAAEP